MITATIKIRYAGDWVDQIGAYDVTGIGVASTFRDHRFVGITALDAIADEFTEIVQTIRENEYVDSVQVLEAYEDDGRVRATLSTQCDYPSITPMQMMRLEGFLPIGYSEYRNGFEFLEILAEDGADVSRVVDVLEYDTVEVVRVISGFRRGIGFSLLEWQELTETVTDEELELCSTALDSGYADIPREVGLDELASESGIAKSTASRRLRNAEQKIIPVITKYLEIFS